MRLIPVIIVLCSSISLWGAPQNEVLVMQGLVETTQKNLTSQKKLLKLLIEFKEAKEAFVKDDDNGKLATGLVKKATLLQQQIENAHLSHLFSSDFLSELQFYKGVKNVR